MSKNIRIKKGYDIKLKGKAEMSLSAYQTEKYALKPTDFIGVFPKLLVTEGDEVQCGTVLCYNKYDERVKFTAPVSGKVVEVKRGFKRVLEEIVIESDGKNTCVDFGAGNPQALKKEEIIQKLLDSGTWPHIRQRPFNCIANPADTPKAIFISAFDSAPLAPDYDFIVKGQENEFQAGLDILTKLTDGIVHLNINKETKAKAFLEAKNVQINSFSGPHPAGNVGIQIHHINPINKGEVVWIVKPQAVISIGKLFLTGHYYADKIIALTGSEVKKTGYFKTKNGACIDGLVKHNLNKGNLRYISGNVLTGQGILAAGYNGFYDEQITVIPEGDQYEFLGWATPGLNKFSLSRSYFSWLRPKKRYALDTNLHGGRRPFVMSGQYDKVFPMNILPVYLLKAILAEDIEKMEKLGIYEVDEEDFALCEVICTSKIQVQKIIRDGLSFIKKEME